MQANDQKKMCDWNVVVALCFTVRSWRVELGHKATEIDEIGRRYNHSYVYLSVVPARKQSIALMCQHCKRLHQRRLLSRQSDGRGGMRIQHCFACVHDMCSRATCQFCTHCTTSSGIELESKATTPSHCRSLRAANRCFHDPNAVLYV